MLRSIATVYDRLLTISCVVSACAQPSKSLLNGGNCRSFTAINSVASETHAPSMQRKGLHFLRKHEEQIR